MNRHEDFLKRLTETIKTAGEILIQNADRIVAQVDDDLGVSNMYITITLPSATDDCNDGPEIDMSTTYKSKKMICQLYDYPE